MATPIEDVIRYLRTEGGSEGLHESFAGQNRIVVSVGGGGMSATEIKFAKAAFLAWADLIDIDFSFSGSNPDITFAYTSDFDGDLEDAAGRVSTFGDRKDVKINRDAFPDDDGLDFGSRAYPVYLHEIGHALGLTHPGNYNGESPKYGVHNVYPEDYTQFTVMSYFDFGEFDYPTEYTDHPATPLLHDVAAIQEIYGARFATRSGDTTYGFGSNNERRVDRSDFDFFDFDELEIANFTIWDGGGIDTIDSNGWVSGGISGVDGTFPHFPHQIIDLREGTFSTIGLQFIPDFPDRPLKNNISIAYGAVIENAIASGGDDVIFGNDVANHLIGNGGIDLILGFDGNDTIEGGGDNDDLLGGDGDDTILGGQGDDILNGDDGNDTLRDDRGTNTLRGGDGDDTLEGGDGDDDLFGGDDDDTLIASGGLDRFFGGEGFDTVSYLGTLYAYVDLTVTDADGGPTFSSIENYRLTNGDDTFVGSDADESINGNDGDDHLVGLGGRDILRGGDDDDTLDGGDGVDVLQGGNHNDSLYGGGDGDELDGGAGVDTMQGGNGDDLYIVDNAGDVVTEFALGLNASPGIDRVISLIDYALTANVEELQLNGTLARNGTGNGLANLIFGNSLGNTLDGLGGADTLRGLAGNDTYIVDNAGDFVDEAFAGGGGTSDTVRSSVAFNLVSSRLNAQVNGEVEHLVLTGAAAINGTGNALGNRITGNGAVNELFGLGGADTLDGGGGGDFMLGGTENDTYVVDNTGDRVSEATGLATDIDSVQSAISFDLRTATGNVENLTLTGSGDTDATGNNLANVLVGNTGANTLEGAIGTDTLEGGGGNDQLNGGRDSDTYLFSGVFGADSIDDIGGTLDRIVVSGGAIVGVLRNASNDALVRFSNGTIFIEDHFAAKTIERIQTPTQTLIFATGTTGGNAGGILTGTEGDDTLDGRGGDDLLFGNLGNDRLLGGTGNDLLNGGLGDDTLEGGTGIDRGVFSGLRADYDVTALSGGGFRVVGPDGTDTVIGLEALVFDDQIVSLRSITDAFDEEFYLFARPDAAANSALSPREHFNQIGWREGVDPNGSFDVAWYLAQNPDVAVAGVNPLDHYNAFGWREGRDPSFAFDTQRYLQSNPDVAAAGVNPLEHFLQFGVHEGRAAPGVIAGDLDAGYYLQENPDVATAGVDPFQHFHDFGWTEGRNPNALFDTRGYLTNYTDVAAANIDPLEHFRLFGWKEGRDPSAAFDTTDYLDANPDVADAQVDPLAHYLRYGRAEGRISFNDGIWDYAI